MASGCGDFRSKIGEILVLQDFLILFGIIALVCQAGLVSFWNLRGVFFMKFCNYRFFYPAAD